MPPAEVRVDARLVSRLLESQHPDLAGPTPVLVDEGWDNFTFRLGPDLAMRIPRREAAVPLLLHEQRWLPVLARRIALAVPEPVAVGAPSELFPWPWSVVRWIEGESADLHALGIEDAERLAASLRALHVAADVDAPTSPVRGVPLAARDDVVSERLARLGRPALAAEWRRALEAPAATEAVWLHGDLHPRNVLVRDAALVALLDWGDMCAGDAATDLACAWTLFEREGRKAFFEAYAPTNAQWGRARGWAVSFTSAMLDSGDARHVEIGEAIERRLVGESHA